jgi:hypothetical protein
MKAPDLHTPWSLGSTEQNHRRWGIWEVHQADYPEPPFYVLMPEYGQWNTERESRQMAALLTRLDSRGHAFTARECS